jgi:GNAT superfamily N-acetyltransferase
MESIMSHWADYVKEREGSSCIERDYGFVEFQIRPPDCEIKSIYVDKSARLKGYAHLLADEVVDLARAQKCTQLWSQVWAGALNSTDALKASLAYGFRVIKAENGCIILGKYIGGTDGQ